MFTSRHSLDHHRDYHRLETQRLRLEGGAPGATPEELTREWKQSHDPRLTMSRRELFQRDLTDKNEMT